MIDPPNVQLRYWNRKDNISGSNHMAVRVILGYIIFINIETNPSVSKCDFEIDKD